MNSISDKSHIIKYIVVFILVLLMAMLSVFDSFSEMERYAEDFLYQRGKLVPADIKIIAIDDRTIDMLGPYSEWDRSVFADLLDILADADEPPKAVGIDVIFSGESETDSDTALAEVAARIQGIVLASKFNTAVRYDRDTGSIQTYVHDESLAYDQLNSVTEHGYASAFPDDDGYLRKVILRLISDGTEYDSFAVKLLDAAGYDSQTASDTVEFLYTSKPGEFEAVSMSDVLDKTVPAGYFADSIVLIGAYSDGMLDSYNVPIEHGRSMYGVEIQANIINAVRNGYIVKRIPVWGELILLAICLVSFGLVASRKSIRISLICIPAFFIIYAVVCFVLFRFAHLISKILYIPIGIIIIFFAMILVRYVELQRRRADELKMTLFSMADSMAEAIEGRTPYNANHTKNVAKRSVEMLRYINRMHKEGRTDMYFSENDIDQMHLAAMLHDIGKMDVPLEVMDKPTKLGSSERALLDRLAIIRLHLENDMLTGRITGAEGSELTGRIDAFTDKIGLFNCGKPLSEEEFAIIDDIADLTYTDASGKVIPYLTAEEKDNLHIKAGTLSDNERTIMQSHVVYTHKILSHVTFGADFDRVADMASNHHELLNGKGYPNGIDADQIDVMTRILTIMDIYDSLIADDRPYKKPKPIEIAFKILDEEAEAGKIDASLLEIAKEMYLS